MLAIDQVRTLTYSNFGLTSFLSIALHFKLTQSNHLPNELHYQPMLDRRRDADLIMRLPDYLTTEIEFTREKANLFFWRLLTFLQSSDKKDNTARH